MKIYERKNEMKIRLLKQNFTVKFVFFLVLKEFCLITEICTETALPDVETENGHEAESQRYRFSGVRSGTSGKDQESRQRNVCSGF